MCICDNTDYYYDDDSSYHYHSQQVRLGGRDRDEGHGRTGEEAAAVAGLRPRDFIPTCHILPPSEVD